MGYELADRLTKEARSRLMAKVRSKDTRPELAVRSALHRLGYRFRLYVRELPGCPDLVFPRARVVVFVDGGFWHGYRFAKWRNSLSDFWRGKIENNMRRDRHSRRVLRSQGWIVVRIWDHEIRKDCVAAIRAVLQALPARRGTP